MASRSINVWVPMLGVEGQQYAAPEEEHFPQFYAWIKQRGRQRQRGRGTRPSSPNSSALCQRPSSSPPGHGRQPSTSNGGGKAHHPQHHPASALPVQQAVPRTGLVARPSSAVPAVLAGALAPTASRQRQRALSRPSSGRPQHGGGTPCYGVVGSSSASGSGGCTSIAPRWLQGLAEAAAADSAAAAAGGGSVARPATSAAATAATSRCGSPLSAAGPRSCLGQQLQAQRVSTAASARAADTAQLLHQQQVHQLHAALQLFRQLPLDGAAARTPMTREGMQLLAFGLQLELARAGAPLQLQLQLQVEVAANATAQQPAGVGAVSEQVLPELRVWRKLSAELCRQARVQCSQRGQLLQAVMDRQQQLLGEALSSCDTLQLALLASASGGQQHLQELAQARQAVQDLQRDNTRLRAALDEKQGKLAGVALELEQQQHRMRRGRFHIIQEEVQRAQEVMEARMLRELDQRLAAARADAAAAVRDKERCVLRAVADVAGPGVVDAVREQLRAGSPGAA